MSLVEQDVGIKEYTPEFQFEILKLLFKRRECLDIAITNKLYFDGNEAIHILYTLCRGFYQKYKEIISSTLLYEELIKVSKERDFPTILIDSLNIYAERLYKEDISNEKAVKDELIRFIKDRRTKFLLQQGKELGKEGKYDQIASLAKDIAGISDDNSLGLFVDPEEIDKRWIERKKSKLNNLIPTGLSGLDILLRNGIGKGELGIVLAPTGLGKTTTLVNFGFGATQAGFVVSYVTLEISADKILARFESLVTGISYFDIIRGTEFALSEMKLCKEKLKGLDNKIFVKEFTTGKCTVNMLDSLIGGIRRAAGRCDLLIVDYIDLMKPTGYVPKDGNIYKEGQMLVRELRSLAVESDVAVWTASQTGRGGYFQGFSKKKYGMEDIGGSRAKAEEADIVIAMFRDETGHDLNETKLAILKGRDREIGESKVSYDKERCRLYE